MDVDDPRTAETRATPTESRPGDYYRGTGQSRAVRAISRAAAAAATTAAAAADTTVAAAATTAAVTATAVDTKIRLFHRGFCYRSVISPRIGSSCASAIYVDTVLLPCHQNHQPLISGELSGGPHPRSTDDPSVGRGRFAFATDIPQPFRYSPQIATGPIPEREWRRGQVILSFRVRQQQSHLTLQLFLGNRPFSITRRYLFWSVIIFPASIIRNSRLQFLCVSVSKYIPQVLVRCSWGISPTAVAFRCFLHSSVLLNTSLAKYNIFNLNGKNQWQ